MCSPRDLNCVVLANPLGGGVKKVSFLRHFLSVLLNPKQKECSDKYTQEDVVTFDLRVSATAAILEPEVRSTLADCVLTGGDDKTGWVIRIIKRGQTIVHGSLVSHNIVLSVFTAFIDVATDGKLVSEFEFIGYENSEKNEFCSQEKKAKKFISPPEWPGFKKENVRDIAFWETMENFVVVKDFPFLFPSNDDIREITQATQTTKTGTQCNLTVLSTKESRLTGFTTTRQVLVSRVTSCEYHFCDSEQICNLENRFEFCTIEKRDTAKDSWERGAVLSCKGSPIGILGVNGKKRRTAGRNLFISLLTAWQVFKKMPIPEITTTTASTTTTSTPTTTMPPTSVTSRKTSTTKATKVTTSTEVTKLTTSTTSTTEKHTSTTSELHNATNLTSPGNTTVLPSRIPSAPSGITETTSEGPTFLRTIPKKVRVRPSKGSLLVLRPEILALCSLVLYKSV